MRSQHLALVASYPDGRARVEHPLDSVPLGTAYGWLACLVPADVVWTCEEVA